MTSIATICIKLFVLKPVLLLTMSTDYPEDAPDKAPYKFEYVELTSGNVITLSDPVKAHYDDRLNDFLPILAAELDDLPDEFDLQTIDAKIKGLSQEKKLLLIEQGIKYVELLAEFKEHHVQVQVSPNP